MQAFSALSTRVDTLIVDTSAGISHSVVQFTQAAQHVLVVVCDEPASMTDAYALVKVMSRNHGVDKFHVLANMTRVARRGRRAVPEAAAGHQPLPGCHPGVRRGNP